MHAPDTADAAEVQAVCYNVLTTLSQRELQIRSVSLPFYGDDKDATRYWELCRAMLQALKIFDDCVGTVNTSLHTVELICSSLFIADVLTTLTKFTFVTQNAAGSNDAAPTGKGTAAHRTLPYTPPDSEWYEVESVLKHGTV